MVEPLDLKTIAYNAGLEIRYAIAASGVDPIQHIPEVDAIIERRLSDYAAELQRLRAEVEELTRSRDEWLAAAVEQRKKAERLTTDPAYQIGYNVGRAEATAEAMERAAQIADCHHHLVAPHHPDKPGDDPIAQGYGNAALNIAAAIRSEASKKGGGG